MFSLLWLVPVVWLLMRIFELFFTSGYQSTKSLKGKVFLMTGANSGLGKEATKQLVARDATVIMACRNKQAAMRAISDIREFTKSGEMIFHELDLSSLASVRKFADVIIKQYPRVDVLINNAGVAVPLVENKKRTADGWEIHFGVNHLGHFLLTQLLLPTLKASAPSRIVILSSIMNNFGNIPFDDLNLDKLRASRSWDLLNAGYSNSKLANLYHGRELAERLQDSNVDVRILCPGIILTGIMDEYKSLNSLSTWLVAVPTIISMGERLSKGASKIVHLATEKDLPGKSGDFYRHFKPVKPTLDRQVQKKLWDISEKLVNA